MRPPPPLRTNPQVAASCYPHETLVAGLLGHKRGLFDEGVASAHAQEHPERAGGLASCPRSGGRPVGNGTRSPATAHPQAPLRDAVTVHSSSNVLSYASSGSVDGGYRRSSSRIRAITRCHASCRSFDSDSPAISL